MSTNGNVKLEPIDVQTAAEQISMAGFVSGISVGLEKASVFVMEQAAEQFRKSNDVAANKLRDLAREIFDLAKIERATYDRERAPIREIAFGAIDAAQVILDERVRP